MTTMNAIVQPAYGSAAVLRFEEVERPAPGNGEVLVRVRAASVCRGDVHLLTGTPYLLRLMFGLRRPKRRVAGQQVAGTVEAVGPGVTTLKPGDEVFGQTPGGAFAEYVCAPAPAFAPKPANLTFDQAAAVPVSGMTALQALRDVGQLGPGQKVLINGASGGVGCFAVQIAKALGAEVTAVCSTRHVDKVRSLGADRVVDYTREDFARGTERYDAMLDLVGNRSIADCKAVLQPKGVLLSSAGSLGWMLKVMLAGMFGSQKMVLVMSTPKQEDLLALRALIEAGKVTPVIERRYALREVPAALGHVAEGHSQGTTVISV
jgi:NADPH:quinone reductase-like Zn-dependent oxidoreductase